MQQNKEIQKDIQKDINDTNKKVALSFNEEKHQYKIGKVILPSATQLLSIYFPFDLDKASRMVAEKLWISQEEVLENWKEIQVQGSHVHFLLEQYCNNEPLEEREIDIIKGAIQFFNDHPHYKILASEIRVFSKMYKLAGTVDLLIRNTDTNRLILLDWKTSQKEIDKEACFQTAKKPIEHLPNNKYYKYSMQLAVYQKLLKETYGIEIFENLIVHVKKDSYKVIIPKNLEWEAEQILNKQKER